jgi:hypothetical protein
MNQSAPSLGERESKLVLSLFIPWLRDSAYSVAVKTLEGIGMGGIEAKFSLTRENMLYRLAAQPQIFMQ